MIATVNAPCFPTAVEELQARFLGILPRIRKHAHIAFRNVVCPAKRADLIAETVALCWRWFRRLAEQGRDGTEFAGSLATFAARAARSGRRLCGQEPAKDALSSRAQQRHGFYAGKLPDVETESGNPLVEALHDNTKTPPPNAAAFRLDFPRWRRRFCRRDRRLIGRLMLGERAQHVARRFHLSPGRVSKMRAAFHDDWRAFCGDLPFGVC